MNKNKNTKSLVSNPHDQFFRESMQDKRVAKEFLQKHLPADLCALVDFDYLSLQPRSQSNAVRRESIVDLLFKTRIAGKESYFYLLLEHQSSPDPLMAFRVLEYTVNAIRDHLKKHNTKKIPLIFPIVVYHGRPYSFQRDITNLVDAPKELVDRYFLKPFHLVDLNKITDAELKQKMWSGLMEFALKHIFKRDFLPFLHDFVPVLRQVHQDGGNDLIGMMLQYIVDSGEIRDQNEFLKIIETQISPELGENIMSLAKQWRKEGMELGVEKGLEKGKVIGKIEGKEELVQKMLEAGADLGFVLKVSGFSMEQIKKLQLDALATD